MSLPRGRQDQKPNPRQPVALARRAHLATPRRTAQRQTAARRAGGGNRPRTAARPCAGRARHRAPHRARRRAAAPAPQRRRDLALALIVARLLEPAAKLATARMLDPATASHSLGEVLGLGKVAAKEVYAALDWLGREQPFIEASWPAATSRMARCCSTTSPPLISKDAAANWRSMATAATTVATGRSLSSA